MKVGNKLHVGILILVLVGALGYIGLQLKSKLAGPNTAVAAPTTATAPSEAPSGATSGLPKCVYGDPFSHVNLTQANWDGKKPKPRVGEASKIDDMQLESERSVTPGEWKQGDIGGNVPLLPPVEGLSRATKSDRKPKNSSGQVPDMAQVTDIRLSGVVSAPNPTAFFSIDGGSTRGYAAGASLGPGITVADIGEGTVQIGFSKGFRTLKVGEKLKLR